MPAAWANSFGSFSKKHQIVGDDRRHWRTHRLLHISQPNIQRHVYLDPDYTGEDEARSGV
jgi:hypothetical protein